MAQDLPDFIVVSPPGKNRWIITAKAFWDRFTFNERADFLIASQIDLAASNGVKRAAAKRQLRRQDIDRDGVVRLKSNKIEDFVNGLETDGILSAGRAAEILTTPGAEDELP
jgi:hypothetical protein